MLKTINKRVWDKERGREREMISNFRDFKLQTSKCPCKIADRGHHSEIEIEIEIDVHFGAKTKYFGMGKNINGSPPSTSWHFLSFGFRFCP